MNGSVVDPSDLTGRLAALEQISAITELKYRYWRACDAKDPSAMRDCFVAGAARIEYGPVGTFQDADALVAVYRSIALRTLDDGRWAVLDMHHGLHPVIEVLDAAHATGRWTLHFRQVDNANGTERVSSGEYEDEYVIEDGAWKIAATRFLPRWSLSRPLADAVVTQ